MGLVDQVGLEDLESLAGPRQSNGSTTRSTGKGFPTATQPRATSIPRQTVPAWTTDRTTGGMTSPEQARLIGLQAGNRPRCRTGHQIERVPEPRVGTMPSEGWTAEDR